MKKHELIEQELCKEIDKIENGLKSGQSMSMDDLRRLDLMYHTLKDISTYNAMKESEEYEGVSEMRGRSPMTGRYVSRDGNNSYADGYSRGYTEAMNQAQGNGGNSGHYPQHPYYPYPERNW